MLRMKTVRIKKEKGLDFETIQLTKVGESYEFFKQYSEKYSRDMWF